MGENGIWSKDQKFYFADLLKGFWHDIQKDSKIYILMAIPLSKDISSANNEWLTREIMIKEISQVVRRIDPLKSLN